MQARRFARALVRHVLDDDVQNVGAMLAYYGVISIFPMAIFVLSVALVVLPGDAVRGAIATAAGDAPAELRKLLDMRAAELVNTASAKFAIAGAAVTLWGASRGAIALGHALNRMNRLIETRSWLRRQVTALVVTAAVGALAVIALLLLVVGGRGGQWLADHVGIARAEVETGSTIVRWLGSSLLVMVMWAIVYKFLPDTRRRFRVFTPGAIVGILLWLAVSGLFSLYLAHFRSYEATYGTLAGAIAFLTWLWLSNIALLLGAEINDVIHTLHAPAGDETAVIGTTPVAGAHVG